MIKVENSFSLIIITTNKLISQEGKVCLFSSYEFLVWSAEPISLHSGTESGFQSSGSGKRLFVSCTVCRVYQKKLANRNVCSDLIASTQSGIC